MIHTCGHQITAVVSHTQDKILNLVLTCHHQPAVGTSWFEFVPRLFFTSVIYLNIESIGIESTLRLSSIAIILCSSVLLRETIVHVQIAIAKIIPRYAIDRYVLSSIHSPSNLFCNLSNRCSNLVISIEVMMWPTIKMVNESAPIINTNAISPEIELPSSPAITGPGCRITHILVAT